MFGRLSAWLRFCGSDERSLLLFCQQEAVLSRLENDFTLNRSRPSGLRAGGGVNPELVASQQFGLPIAPRDHLEQGCPILGASFQFGFWWVYLHNESQSSPENSLLFFVLRNHK